VPTGPAAGPTGPAARLSPASRPRLARKARLRFDRKSERYMLLYPEKGLVLNPAAAEVLKLCTGEHRVDEIVARLAAAHGADAAAVEREVGEFLASMLERALVEDSPP
jgi:coenzyme PQQ biosynthesis protein PqqD